MGYDIDKEKFQEAIEDTRKAHELFDEALGKGWKPNFEKAIESWRTACLELEVGEGYVEHILEEHSEADIITHIEPVLVSQAEYFLAELEDEPTETQKRITIAAAIVKLKETQDGYGLKITNIDTSRNMVVVSVDDNPLSPQAVFAVMECFIKYGAKDADWKGTDKGVDLIAITS